MLKQKSAGALVNQTEVIAKLQPIFETVFREPVILTPASIVPESDSLMQIAFVVAVEKAFGVCFRVGEVEDTKNVGELADLILKRMQER